MRLEKKNKRRKQNQKNNNNTKNPTPCMLHEEVVGEVFGLEPKMFFQATKEKTKSQSSSGHIGYTCKSDTMVSEWQDCSSSWLPLVGTSEAEAGTISSPSPGQ